ncbi:hypothetical protein HELRODRAFT_169150 [Helobdella robusta]|uniref:Uncharacterized protein n=1 Tax=Helobdella robusta TaxID=6412 RepID=T1F1H2_HELRO|nr:hypothetical protein HELRODRAFT_169150 [Helobdella robusta]ESO08339.1 hypothetical protein HELRODRAFT_169150 [Helobdella robusta]
MDANLQYCSECMKNNVVTPLETFKVNFSEYLIMCPNKKRSSWSLSNGLSKHFSIVVTLNARYNQHHCYNFNDLYISNTKVVASNDCQRFSNPSPTRLHRSGFLPGEQSSPAGLLRMLLLQAGIESNPGPKIWICEICNKRVNKTHNSVRCRTCCKWTHLNNCTTNLGSYYLCNNCPNPTTIPGSPVRGAQPNRLIIRNKTSATPNINLISHSDSKLNILQFNCNGLKNKSAEIAHHLSIHNISIAALQETKLSTRSAVQELCYIPERPEKWSWRRPHDADTL